MALQYRKEVVDYLQQEKSFGSFWALLTILHLNTYTVPLY